MRIVIVNTSERKGGAATAAHRLYKALAKEGHDVFMLVRDKQSNDPQVFSINEKPATRCMNRIRFLWERLLIFITNRFNRKKLFRVSTGHGIDLSEHPLLLSADIIHLHWVNQCFLSLNAIRKLAQRGNVVWTLHDLWPVTAVCHYPGECQKYKKGCSHCELLPPIAGYDWAKAVFREKARSGLEQIYYIGCSEWITRKAKECQWVKQIVSIPNTIDRTLFRTKERTTARRRFNLPPDKTLLLFAADNLSDTRKGAIYLVEACRLLKEKGKEIELLFMGNASEELSSAFPYKVNNLGYLTDPEAIADAYNCANLFVIPSLEDNLPNTIIEAMACGVPCIGFRTGGIPEIIDHCQNGYLADRKDAAGLVTGIEWIIEHAGETLSAACTGKVNRCYSETAVTEQYTFIYRKLSEHATEIFNHHRNL